MNANPPSGSAGLFVGVNEFQQDQSLDRLQFAVNDAIETAYTFVFDLKLIAPNNCFLLTTGTPSSPTVAGHLARLRDAGATIKTANRTNILVTLLSVTAAAKEESDLLVCSLSSHGFDERGEAYVMPGDGVRQLLAETAVALRTIEFNMNRSRAGHRLLLVDACQERVSAKAGGPAGVPVSAAFAASLEKPSGQAKISSCSLGEFSFEHPSLGPGGQGVFTHSFLKAVRGAAEADQDGVIRLGKVVDYVATDVARWTEQNRRSRQTPFKAMPVSAASLPLAIRAKPPARIADEIELFTGETGLTTVERALLSAALDVADPAAAQDRDLVDATRDFLDGKLPVRYFRPTVRQILNDWYPSEHTPSEIIGAVRKRFDKVISDAVEGADDPDRVDIVFNVKCLELARDAWVDGVAVSPKATTELLEVADRLLKALKDAAPDDKFATVANEVLADLNDLARDRVITAGLTEAFYARLKETYGVDRNWSDQTWSNTEHAVLRAARLCSSVSEGVQPTVRDQCELILHILSNVVDKRANRQASADSAGSLLEVGQFLARQADLKASEWRTLRSRDRTVGLRLAARLLLDRPSNPETPKALESVAELLRQPQAESAWDPGNLILPRLDALRESHGQKAKLGSIPGHPFVVITFAKWCPPCIHEVRTLGQIASEYELGLIVIDVAEIEAGVDLETHQEALTDNLDCDFEWIGGGFGTALGRSDLFDLLPFETVPRTFLVDANGRIEVVDVGWALESQGPVYNEKAERYRTWIRENCPKRGGK